MILESRYLFSIPFVYSCVQRIYIFLAACNFFCFSGIGQSSDFQTDISGGFSLAMKANNEVINLADEQKVGIQVNWTPTFLVDFTGYYKKKVGLSAHVRSNFPGISVLYNTSESLGKTLLLGAKVTAADFELFKDAKSSAVENTIGIGPTVRVKVKHLNLDLGFVSFLGNRNPSLLEVQTKRPLNLVEIGLSYSLKSFAD